jgi:hypothetical protein
MTVGKARDAEDRQLDLFSTVLPYSVEATRAVGMPSPPEPSEIEDADLVAALPDATLAEAVALTAEAGRRRLAAAVPALERLCRRFTAFGLERIVPEQASALEALSAIGGPEAAASVARVIVARAVQGPALAIALSAAVHLGSRLPREVRPVLLCDADRRVRALACRLAGSSSEEVDILTALLDDLDGDVALAAASALGRVGRPVARTILLRHLRAAPSPEVIDAVAGVADADCIVVLARIAREHPDLAAAARDALEQLDDPLAARVLASLS